MRASRKLTGLGKCGCCSANTRSHRGCAPCSLSHSTEASQSTTRCAQHKLLVKHVGSTSVSSASGPTRARSARLRTSFGVLWAAHKYCHSSVAFMTGHVFTVHSERSATTRKFNSSVKRLGSHDVDTTEGGEMA